MKKEIIKLQDAMLIDIKTDNDVYSGCETCNYGGYYLEEINFYFDNDRKVSIEMREDYGDESFFSYGDLLAIFTNNFNELQDLCFEDFEDYMVKKVKEQLEIEDDEYNRFDVTGYTY